MDKPKILCICGTRPDAIKTAPVVQELRKFDCIETILLSTGQHREMLASALSSFGLKPDYDLQIMSQGQSLAQVTTRALEGIDKVLEEIRPDFVIAQGDTSTTFVASLAAFYRKIPFGHVEAGLRTETIWDPFPEEFNRRATGLITALHFAPTEWSKKNLLDEKVDPKSIFVTGNTGIDALMFVANNSDKVWFPENQGRLVLLTTHRRENLGDPQKQIAQAFREVIDSNRDTFGVVPMHKNPLVRDVLTAELGGHDRIHLIEPPDYVDFVTLMKRAHLILTDSGGVQEEAPSFGMPVLILRETTERPEGVQVGIAKLIGTNKIRIVTEANTLLQNQRAYQNMSGVQSPYGDGKASARIRYSVLAKLGIKSPEILEWTS